MTDEYETNWGGVIVLCVLIICITLGVIFG